MSLAARVARRRGVTAGVTPFFSDDFAGGALNPSGGFTYTALGASGSLSTEQAHSGTHSVKILYAAKPIDTNGQQGGNVELRFDLGRYVSEIWIEYWFFASSGYVHRLNSVGSGLSSNNKFLLLWRDSAQYFTTEFLGGQEMQYDYGATNPNGSDSRLYATKRTAATPADVQDFSNGVPAVGGTNGVITVNQWHQLRTHWKPSSAAGVSDGVYQWWVDGVQKHNYTGQDFWNHTTSAETNVRFKSGYFMGSCDSGFTADTSVYLDDLKFYDVNPGWV